MPHNRQLYKNNLRWSLVSAALVFGGLFSWLLYYAATATEKTNAYPHLLGFPIFRVNSIEGGFEIGPEYGIVILPLIAGAAVFVLSLLFRYATTQFTRSLPE